MSIRLHHPITHDGVAYSRGVYHDLDPELEQELLDIKVHTGQFTENDEGRKVPLFHQPAAPFVEQNPVMGKATAAIDAPKKNDPSKPPAEAKIPEPAAPDTSQPGKMSHEAGREPRPEKQEPVTKLGKK